MKKLCSAFRRMVVLAALYMTLLPASAALINRYSFNGNANDSVGGKNGTASQLRDANGPIGSPVVFQSGEAVLDGTGAYVDLPNGLVSGLTNVTIEAWITWGGSGAWCRIFDFGNSTVGEETDLVQAATGVNTFFLTPQAGGGGALPRFDVTAPAASSTLALPANEPVYVALSYGPSGSRIYINGAQTGTGPFIQPLANVPDVNDWLGRSNFTVDSMFNGSYNEFRIHNNILSSLEIAASKVSGPDAVNYDPGTISAISLTVEGSVKVGATQIPQITGTFSRVGQVTLSASDVTISSSATNVVRVTAAGELVAAGVGNATITVTRGGQSDSEAIAVSPAAAAALKHRYSFNGTGVTVTDSIGGQNGEIKPPFPTTGVPNPGSVVLTNGQAFFPSGTQWDSAGYIDLPNGLISSKTNITIETWVTWNGPNNNANQTWARIFDFGDSSKGEDAQFPGNGDLRSYLFLTPRANADTLRFAARPGGGAENPVINISPTIAVGQEAYLVVVYAPEFQVSRVYINGVLLGSGTAPTPLSAMNDINNWLGASQWQGDLPYYGFINEFRIYEGLRTDLEIALARSAGPDALAPAPGNLQSVSLNAVPSLLAGDPTAAQATLIANFQNTTNVNVSAVSGAAFTSSDTNVFTVSATGAVTPRNAGNASLVGSFQSLSSTTSVSVLAPTALRHQVPATLNVGGAVVNAGLFADFATQTNVNVAGFAGVTRSSSNTNVLTIAPNGNVIIIAVGTATITSTYGGRTATTSITVRPQPAGFQQDNAGLVVMEAESVTAATLAPDGHSWSEQTARAGASGSRYLQVLPDSGISQTTAATATANSPRLDFKVNFTKTGTHYIWIRGADPAGGGAGDSVHAGIDGTLPDTSLYFGGAGVPAPGFNIATGWAWVGAINATGRATVQVATAGLHTVNVWMREDGFLFDKIIVTSDAAFTPTDTGPAESARLAPPPIASLIHRYSFTSDAADSIGTAHGQAVAFTGGTAPVFANGQVVLAGTATTGGYIDLPNGLISGLTSVTLETWVTVNNNQNWARIWDFGTSSTNAANPTGERSPSQPIGTGIDYMFLTANAAASLNARFAITDTDQAALGGERPSLNDTQRFPTNTPVYTVVAYGPPVARLYVNGRLAASGTAVIPLSELKDVNNWLGRSQWGDPFFNGSYDEFRIHNAILTDAQINASMLAGPDTLNYGTDTGTAPKFTSATVTAGSLKIEWTGGGTLESAANITGPWATVNGASSPYTTPASAAAQFYRVKQ